MKKEITKSSVKKRKLNKISKKKIFRIIFLVIIIVLLVLLIMFGISKYRRYKYKKILEKNDSVNYELTQIVNGEESESCKLRDNTLVLEDGETEIWVSSKKNKSIVMNNDKKTAIVTIENEVKVASLNSTFINEFFENSDNKFKYLGKEKNHVLLQFTNKNTKLVTILYLNLDTKLIDKQITKNEFAENVIEYKIKLNSVSKDEVKEPDLTEYYVINQ